MTPARGLSIPAVDARVWDRTLVFFSIKPSGDDAPGNPFESPTHILLQESTWGGGLSELAAGRSTAEYNGGDQTVDGHCSEEHVPTESCTAFRGLYENTELGSTQLNEDTDSII